MRGRGRAARAVFAFAVAAAVNQGPASAEKITVSRDARGKTITLAVDIVLPKNASGKTPAMIIVHGSGGVRAAREYAYAKAFNDIGIAAVVVDSFSPRGIKTTVTDQSPVSAYDMLVDATAVLGTIAYHPAIDPSRIGLIGFSKGGTVAVKAALRRYVAPLLKDDARFALLVAVYPWCGDMPLDFTSASAPLIMMLGADDTYAGTAACREYAQRFSAAGGNLMLTVYPNAKHGWDTPGSTAWYVSRGENASKCINDEVSPGKWVERISRLTVFENNKPAADAKAARARCGTRGVSGGYDSETAKRSLQDIRNAVRTTFHLE